MCAWYSISPQTSYQERGTETPIKTSSKPYDYITPTKISRNQDTVKRELTRRALEDRFKNFYENSGQKVQRSKTPDISSAVKEYKQRSVKEPAPQPNIKHLKEFPKERSLSSMSSCSSQCSQCSGAAKKGMEYVCVNCINKEIADERSAQKRREMTMNRESEKALAEKFEREKKKYEKELMSKKQERINKVRQEMKEENERQQLKRVRE
jgi:hypothetical protein